MNAKQTVSDVKTDLRTTKEDIMSELKDSREVILSDIDAAMNVQIELLKTEIENLNKRINDKTVWKKPSFYFSQIGV